MSVGGKGFFIWKIKKCENGDVKKIAQLAHKAGFSHVIIKVANGIWKYNYDWENHVDWCPDLVEALRDNGIEPWGWHYVFGEDPMREARVAIERVKGLGLKGYVIDAEAHYKRKKNRYEALILQEEMNTFTLLGKEFSIGQNIIDIFYKFYVDNQYIEKELEEFQAKNYIEKKIFNEVLKQYYTHSEQHALIDTLHEEY